MDLTQGALFRHFASKEAVWEAVMDWVAEQLLACVDQATAGVASPLAALEAAFLAHVEFVVDHPGVPRILFGELQRAEDTAAKRRVRALIAQYGERLTGLVEAGKARGELAAEVDTGAAVAQFIGTIQGLVMQSLLAGDPERIRSGAPNAFALYRRGIASAAMSRLTLSRRSLALIAVLVPLLALFVWVVLRSGPLAPVPVTVVEVESRSIAPALFGIGTVEARYTYRIGPTVAGRVLRVEAQVGDRVAAGDFLGEMDPIDIDQRLAAQEAAIQRAHAGTLAAEAQILEVSARRTFAQAQERRYEQLAVEQVVSQEAVESRRQESQIAAAAGAAAGAQLEAARQELTRARAERDALLRQRAHLRLVAPVDGLVVARSVDPGTTVVAGQAVVEMIAPDSLWIQTRFEQLLSSGLRAGLPVRIVLRSRSSEELAGTVLRLEPVADAVTEESLAKVVFDALPGPPPSVGELAEVTVALPPLPVTLVVPNASVQRLGDQPGVWVIEHGELRFAPARIGETDLDGRVQILDGLEVGAQVVVYSQRALGARSRVKVVERLPGVAP